MAIIFCTWFFVGPEIPKIWEEDRKIIGKHA